MCKGKGFMGGMPLDITLPCNKCHGEGTIKESVTFELWEECKCINGYVYSENNHTGIIPCKCGGDKIPHYITPAEWEAKMGEKLGNDAPVWALLYNKGEPGVHWWKGEYLMDAYAAMGITMVLAIPGQPAPADDWRPE